MKRYKTEKRRTWLLILAAAVFILNRNAMPCVYASEAGNSLTTITVDASDSESGGLLYSIDSDAPEAFTTSNEFVVESGSSHTVYVKDAAGNISSQLIDAPVEKVGIEVTIGQDGTDSSGIPDLYNSTPAVESGGGTVNETTNTAGTGTDDKIFYTITTPSEHVFYMVIDNTRSSDNVYLLNQVTEEDLLALVPGADAKKTENSLFNSNTEDTARNAVDNAPAAEEPETSSKSREKGSDMIILLVMVLMFAGIYYYIKVYKPKKAAEMELSDAMDIDDFEAEEEPDEDELIFEETDAEKEELLRQITSEAYDEEPGERNEEKSGNHMDASDNDDYLNKSLSEFDSEIEEELSSQTPFNEEGENDDETFI